MRNRFNSQLDVITESSPYLVEQVCQGIGHTVFAHVEADQCQVSAVSVQVIQALLLEGGAL